MKKLLATILSIGFSLNIANSQAAPFLMSYWSNWNIYSNNPQTRAIAEPAYGIPGSMDSGSVVSNPDLQTKLNKINALTYDFLEIAADGTVYFNDPWSDLRADSNFANYNKLFGAQGLCTINSKICANTQTPDPYAHGNFQAFLNLQNQQNNLRKMISIGGWGHDDSFINAFNNPERFITTVNEIITTTGLDGIDLDFEPTTIDATTATNYAKLIQNLRQKLGPNKIISIAVLAGPDWLNSIGKQNWDTIKANVNTIDLMTYDFHGGFDISTLGKTGFISSLTVDPVSPYKNDFSIQSSVTALQTLGIPNPQIVIGIPAYGRGLYQTQSGDSFGLFQSFQNVAQGDMDPANCAVDPKSSVACSGSFQYNYIVNYMLPNGLNEHQFTDASFTSGTWAYAASWTETSKSVTYPNLFISYVNAKQAADEAKYIKAQGLGGIMMWELRGDILPGQAGSLWDAIVANIS